MLRWMRLRDDVWTSGCALYAPSTVTSSSVIDATARWPGTPALFGSSSVCDAPAPRMVRSASVPRDAGSPR